MTDDLELRILRRLAHHVDVLFAPNGGDSLDKRRDLRCANHDYLTWKGSHWICGKCNRAYPKTITQCEDCGP